MILFCDSLKQSPVSHFSVLQKKLEFVANATVIFAKDGYTKQYKSKKGKGEVKMKKYVCEPCGYEYDPAAGDPDNGIAPGTAFEDLPEDWVCPICGMGKDAFVEE